MCCPTGKSLLISGNRVKPQNKKYFAFPEGQIRGTSIAIPSRSEGRIMIATIVGRVAVDAGSADNERRESVRQRRVVLTPDMLASKSWGNKLLRSRGRKRPSSHPPERVISRTP